MTAIGTLARYISLRFLLGIMGIFLLCLLLIFLIDFVELLRRSGKFGSVPIWTLAWITILRLPSFAELTLPFAVLAGSIGALLLLSRSSELVVVRATGMSVWQFMIPGIAVSFIIGAFAVVIYNPLAATAKAKSERIYAEKFGRSESLLKTKAGSWLRQDSVDGQSVIHALAVANQGMLLTGVTIFQFSQEKSFLERIDARKAELKNGRWELSEAWVNSLGRQPVFYERFVLSTYLTPTQVTSAVGSVETISFWDLPSFIEIVERAGLSATRYKVQYQLLLSKPILLSIMVLFAATCSLKAFRFGKIQRMVIIGLIAGFGFFIFARVSHDIGLAGLISPSASAWVPVLVGSLLALTVLLYQEDG